MFANLLLAGSIAFGADFPLDSNLLRHPGFEAGMEGWSFWARSPDTCRVRSTSLSRSGDSGLLVECPYPLEWALASQESKIPVNPGELWEWSIALKADSLPEVPSASFVTFDSAGTVLDWSVSPRESSRDTGWQILTTRYQVPRSVSRIQPRLVGSLTHGLVVDDARFSLVSQAPESATPLRIGNDSLALEIDPLDLSMILEDRILPDTMRIGPLSAFRLDSVAGRSDSLELRLVHLVDEFKCRLLARLQGGALILRLEAAPSSPLGSSFLFPGSIPTRTGQRIAIPRGTGVSWPVDGPRSSLWPLQEAPFWDWQVSQALTGATDGRTGFVLSFASPSGARLAIGKSGDAPSRAEVLQVPMRDAFGPARQVLVAPLRGGGFPEMARRHREHRETLGQVRNWSTKRASLPAIAKLEGAVDWWVNGGGWSWRFFDSLRLMGMDRALVHWNWASAESVDSLESLGYLASFYDNWADAFPGDSSPQGREYPEGAIVKYDGTLLSGWLEKHPDGSTRQALEICSARHPHLARAIGSAAKSSSSRNARFVDVELSIGLQECWSSTHPVDREEDLRNRIRSLGILKDSLSFVVGSEQTRDAAHAVVDYGEGPMSIASTENAGYDWSTLEPPDPKMDALSMDPAIRVPLLLLADHDAFAPTWYTGDGQSKVPLRWDDKDAWNMLYATMPLIMPKSRAMWDSLRPRYLRTILTLGPFLQRTHFARMVRWETRTDDRRVQSTEFDNGWRVFANFDSIPRSGAGFDLPPKGFSAMGPGSLERVERTLLDGAVRTRVRMSDRWFLDPEGSECNVDGIRTPGPVGLRRLDDSTLLLTILGSQDHVDIRSSALPWPSTSLGIRDRSGRRSIAITRLDSGWTRVSSDSTSFLLLSGDFSRSASARPPSEAGLSAALRRTGNAWTLEWIQTSDQEVHLRRFGPHGRRVEVGHAAGVAGWNHRIVPALPYPSWILLENSEGSIRIAVPPLP